MDILTLLYSVSGLIFGAAFIPQIRTLLRDQTGAMSINITTWAMFSTASFITLLYAMLHNGDTYFIFCSAICTAGNITVLSLASLRRLAVVQLKDNRFFKRARAG